MSSSRPQRQSWRQSSAGAGQAKGSNRRSRWFLSLLAATLMAALVWIVWGLLGRANQTHVVALIAGNHAKLSVPSLPYGHYDLRPLEEHVGRAMEFKDWSHLLEADRIGQLGNDIGRLNLGKKDTLIVYLSAHGLANLLGDQQAHILCRDFDLSQPERSCFAVEQLLESLAGSDAERKLLVLDTGYLASDTRLGIWVNEFPRLVQQAVANSPQSELWVLLSNSIFQTNTIQSRKSVFGQSFVAGLMGAANANGDRQVDLLELYRYVAGRCQRESGGLQTVQVFRSGLTWAEVHPLPRLPLMTIDPVQEPGPTEPETASESDETAVTDPRAMTRLTAQVNEGAPPEVTEQAEAAEPDKSVATAADATEGPASTSGPSEVSARPTPPPDDRPQPSPPARDETSADPNSNQWLQMRAQLDEAWKLRDQLQEVPADRSWLPLEYAPHLWRELNQLLLDSELWLLSGPNHSLALQIEKHVDGLRSLRRAAVQAEPRADMPIGDLVTDRLLRAQAEFVASTTPSTFQPESEQLNQVAQDVRRLRRVIFLLPEYVRWYSLSSFATPDDDDQLDNVLAHRIESLLTRCNELQDIVRQNRNRRLSRQFAAQVRDDIDQLARTHRDLNERLDFVLSQALTRLSVPAFRRHLSIYLQTSLPALAWRQRLRAELARADSVPTGVSFSEAVTDPLRASVSRVQWQRVMRRSRMEEGLIRLVDPRFSLNRLSDSFQDTDEAWRQIRDIGASLRTAYVGLDRPAGQFASLDLADRLRIIDGRDAPQVTSLSSGFPQLGLLPPRLPAKLRVVWSAGSEMPLQREWRDLQLKLSSTASSVISVAIGFQFDESAVQLRTKSGQTIRPGKYPPIDLRESRDLDLQIRSRKEVTDPSETTVRQVKVVALAAQLRGEAQLRCLLPRPDDVELVAIRVGATEPEVSFSGVDQMIQLRCYPDRTTHFRLRLRNVSGRPKSVQVRVLAIPRIRRATWPPGRILGDDQEPFPLVMRSLFEPDGRRLLPDVSILAQTQNPLVLSADGAAVDLDFGRSTDGSADSPDAPPVRPADEPPGAAPTVDVSGGLLCVIEEPDRRWLKWIELQPIPPRDYVKVDVLYDLHRLNIALQPRSPERMPLGLEKAPIPITWEIDRLIEEGLRVGDRVETGTMAAVGDRVQLYADVASSRDRQASVRLTVDGYPRAFIFELPLDRRSEQNDPRRDLPELVIQSVAVSNFPRVYVWSEAEKHQFVAQRHPDDQREVVVMQPGQAAAFPKPDVGDQMEIRLRADAAVSAFGRSDVNDRITVELKDRLGITTFQDSRFADREARFDLVELADGRIGIESQVNDHRIVARPERMEGDYQLMAAMFVGSEELQYPRIPIVFDGQVPRILRPLSVSPTQVDVGKHVDVSFEVTDQSGLAKIEVGLVKKLDDPLDDKKKIVLERSAGPLIRVRLITDEPGKFWVKAVVEDGVGKSITTRAGRDFHPIQVEVNVPVEAGSTTDAANVVGRVFGYTQIRSRKIDRIEVTLTGDKDFPPVASQNGGEFEFLEVPAGKYELTASGYWNGERVGSLPLELKEPGDFRPFVIQLQAKPRE